MKANIHQNKFLNFIIDTSTSTTQIGLLNYKNFRWVYFNNIRTNSIINSFWKIFRYYKRKMEYVDKIIYCRGPGNEFSTKLIITFIETISKFYPNLNLLNYSSLDIVKFILENTISKNHNFCSSFDQKIIITPFKKKNFFCFDSNSIKILNLKDINYFFGKNNKIYLFNRFNGKIILFPIEKNKKNCFNYSLKNLQKFFLERSLFLKHDLDKVFYFFNKIYQKWKFKRIL
jgi:hypothetical protein